MFGNSESGMSSQDKFDRFEAWLRENGARFDMVSLACSVEFSL